MGRLEYSGGASAVYSMAASIYRLRPPPDPGRDLGRPRRRRARLAYFLIPRRVPGSFAGKGIWILVGGLVALAAETHRVSLWRSALAFGAFDLVVCQGKYLINDYVGRDTDVWFSRGKDNLFPRGGRAARAVLMLASLRIVAGVIGFDLLLGPPATAAPLAMIALQALYEGLKTSARLCKHWTLAATIAAGYGVRMVSGLLIVAGGAALWTRPTGALMVWGFAGGLIFVYHYWRVQAAEHWRCSTRRATPPSVLQRKPYLLWFRASAVPTRDTARSHDRPGALLMLAMSASALSISGHEIVSTGGPVPFDIAVIAAFATLTAGCLLLTSARVQRAPRLGIILGPVLAAALLMITIGAIARAATWSALGLTLLTAPVYGFCRGKLALGGRRLAD